jgi:ABC-2 type transport system permease protein
VVLPATFLSATLMASNLLPGWIRGVSRFNPVDWAVVAGRTGDWSSTVGLRIALLVGLATACAFVAARAVGTYSRSV